MNTQDAIKFINKTRKENKNKWFWININVNGDVLELKAYNTWVQWATYKGSRDSGLMDISVKQFNQQLERWLK